jgi:hypothetical protein
MTTNSSFIHPDFEQTDSSNGISMTEYWCVIRRRIKMNMYDTHSPVELTEQHTLRPFSKIVAIPTFLSPLGIMTGGLHTSENPVSLTLSI